MNDADDSVAKKSAAGTTTPSLGQAVDSLHMSLRMLGPRGRMALRTQRHTLEKEKTHEPARTYRRRTGPRL